MVGINVLVGGLIIIPLLLGLAAECSGSSQTDESGRPSLGVFLQVMERQAEEIGDILLLVAPYLSARYTVTLFLSTDNPEVFQGLLLDLNKVFGCALIRKVPDLGDEGNMVRAVHRVLEHEGDIWRLRVKSLVLLDVVAFSDRNPIAGNKDSIGRDTALAAEAGFEGRDSNLRPQHVLLSCSGPPLQEGSVQHKSCQADGMLVAGRSSSVLAMMGTLGAVINDADRRHQLLNRLSEILESSCKRLSSRCRLFELFSEPSREKSDEEQLLSSLRELAKALSLAPLPEGLRSEPGGIATDMQALTISGYPGRLGNWMFRAASAMALAWDSGRDFVLPNTVPCLMQHPGEPYPPDCTFSGSFLSSIRRIPTMESIGWNKLIHEDGFGYDAILREQVLDATEPNVVLFGFLQSHLFFHHHREQIQDHLSLPPHMEAAASYVFADLMAGMGVDVSSTERGELETISMHVRRTDYAQYPDKHTMLEPSYYVKAVDLIRSAIRSSESYEEATQLHILVSCDDIQWCKHQEWIIRLSSSVTFITDIPDFIQMRVMSLCKHHIIANSSFSWWAAYLSSTGKSEGRLSRNGVVVAPRTWFGREGPLVELESLFPPEWIAI